MRLYAESEELIYKMCNDKNDPIRKGAINKDFKGLHLISAMWRNGMAAPSSKKILQKIEKGTLKVSYKKFGKFKMLASKYKMDKQLILPETENILSLIYRNYWATEEEKANFSNKDKNEYIGQEFKGNNIHEIFEQRKK